LISIFLGANPVAATMRKRKQKRKVYSAEKIKKWNV